MWLFWPLFPGAGPQGTAARLGDGARVHFRPSACLCTRILKSKGERRAAISILSVCLPGFLTGGVRETTCQLVLRSIFKQCLHSSRPEHEREWRKVCVSVFFLKVCHRLRAQTGSACVYILPGKKQEEIFNLFYFLYYMVLMVDLPIILLVQM